MFARNLQRLLGASLAVSTLGFAAPVFAEDAESIDIFYRVPRIGIAISVLTMGYNNPEGTFVSLAGQQITSGRVVVDFTPGPGVDVTTLHMDMAVPVTGAQSQFFEVNGSDLIQVSPGVYHYELTTTMFNGTIYEGRFGIESYGLTPDGGAVALDGDVGMQTGFYFTTTSPVPEPTSAWLLLAGLVAVPVVARRRAKQTA